MDRKKESLEQAEAEKVEVEALRSELEGREPDDEKKAFSDPFVAHGGKPPVPPPPSV